ncbi:hypothetical protein [Sulfurimonas sp.]|uniref:hypothetical protein n=1 Tax=Sulfurimonas sp. TaxID=2022749 RepID=UPI003562E209
MKTFIIAVLVLFLVVPLFMIIPSMLSESGKEKKVTTTLVDKNHSIQTSQKTTSEDIGAYGTFNLALILIVLAVFVLGFKDATSPGAGSMITMLIVGSIGFYIFALIIGNAFIYFFIE